MLRICTDGWGAQFVSAEFWRRAWSATLAWAPRFAVCAAWLAAANLLVVLSTAFMEARLDALQNKPLSDLSALIAVGLVALATVLLAIPISLWALWQWLLKLTAFARWWQEGAPPLEPEQLKESVNAVVARAGYFARVWLVASIYLLVPAIPLSLLIGLHTTFTSKSSLMRIDPTVLKLPEWILAPSTHWTAGAVALVLTVITLAYTFVTIAFSAASKLPAGKTANAALQYSLRNWLPLCTMTSIVLVANVVITAPQMVLYLTPVGVRMHTAVVETCAQLWLALTSTVVWPLSVVPFCSLVCNTEQEVVARD